MTFFFERYIGPLLKTYPNPRILEIGASEGKHTHLLLSVPDATLTIIDPCLDKALDQEFFGDPRVRIIKATSLEGLPRLTEQFEAILIDGDHNWYTVISELRLVAERWLLAKGGVLLFHDVEWPYGRRDMYYRPELVPEGYRQAFAQEGIERGKTRLSATSQFNAHLYNAINEGGERNGVLTAIEDFMAESEAPMELFRVTEENGLGVMVRRADKKANTGYREMVSNRRREQRKAYFRERLPWLYRLYRRFRSRG